MVYNEKSFQVSVNSTPNLELEHSWDFTLFCYHENDSVRIGFVYSQLFLFPQILQPFTFIYLYISFFKLFIFDLTIWVSSKRWVAKDERFDQWSAVTWLCWISRLFSLSSFSLSFAGATLMGSKKKRLKMKISWK